MLVLLLGFDSRHLCLTLVDQINYIAGASYGTLHRMHHEASQSGLLSSILIRPSRYTKKVPFLVNAFRGVCVFLLGMFVFYPCTCAQKPVAVYKCCFR